MKLLSTLVASALALTTSVQAANCNAGLNYCASVLKSIDFKYVQMMNAAIGQKYGDFNADLVHPMLYLWHCNADGSVSIVKRCDWDCVDGGAGNSDYCQWQQ
ncbi:hypothetical protein AtubIFM55763_007087 [Aspergillus tubingensis]|uniref:uncharacterized protein n=1 Tax=Aspergillus tubingensis TaxID=5068 RepID=UPI0015786AB2|nr:uncharacterized protein AtWU_05780 [Aspergillus tubingensis]GFN15979.1 hypothetical protein AtWU_05780 [Aspergillus tubingensis]GLA68887.1 hypothetical protein AtubIFM55763_007087 [Aspergillus tubingensis]GLA91025.1 hypothetical protein AtubIFM57143_003041 [Aspergillus tubingensis]